MTPVQKAACLLPASLCAYFLASFLFTVLANYFPGPFYDYWVDIAKVETFFNNPASLHLPELLAAHNDAHRLFIPRLLFILDHLLANGTNAFLVSISLLCKLTTLILFNLVIHESIAQKQKNREQNLSSKIWLNAIFFAGIFSLGNVSNIMMTSNIQWDLMLAFSFLSLYFFSNAQHSYTALLLSILFLFASFLSHGASLAIPVVFLLHSLMIRDRKLAIISAILLAMITLLHFVILPAWTGETSDSVATLIPMLDAGKMLLWLIHLVNFILHFLYAPVRQLGITGFYFSLVFLFLFALCWQRYRKNPAENTFFSLLSLFLALTIILIAAGRVNTNPDFYWASQYEPIAIMFILSVTTATIVTHPAEGKTKWLPLLAIVHYLFMLVWNQLQPYPYGFYRSNKALNSHTYMFMFDRDQYQGDALKIWVMDPDPVKAIDAFFDQHHFAYYHNKQGGTGRYQHFIRPGEPFITADDLPAFAHTCSTNREAVTYQPGQFGKYNFSTPINLAENSYLDASLHRNSYYVLDSNGTVIGFAFIFMPPQSLWPKPALKGLLNTQDAVYIAEVLQGKPRCRYVLTSP